MESEKIGIDDLIYKAEIETKTEQTYGYQGGKGGGVGWTGRLGLTYIHYCYYI